MVEEKKKENSLGLSLKKAENFSEWYNELVLKAGLADYAPVAGCMVIKPYGYALWERIQAWFDTEIKKTGVSNAYFPMFIPERFLKKEAEHFEGFVPEVAWIEKKEESEEHYALRPTSETIIYDLYSNWIRSWRDLPLRLNQWCNIVRWEVKATKLFLRTREFLWQEGHTVHATEKEAETEVLLRAEQYKRLMETQLAVPVLMGKKSKSETFAGALYTIALEALMPDGKALQMGTSHNLGQHFSKVFGIEFLDSDEKKKHAWQTSWGFSTRLIGSLVMVHGDDKGLIMPPNIAPVQIVIVPIFDNKTKDLVLDRTEKIQLELEKYFRVEADIREEYTPGWKFHEWELKGIPLRIEIGPKDIEKEQVIFVRRDNGAKLAVAEKACIAEADVILREIQESLFKKAKKFLGESTVEAADFDHLKKSIEDRKLVIASWCGEQACEESVKDQTTATIRCLTEGKPSVCAVCGKPGKHVAYWAIGY
jgi:prolyl-tRNA synthetase